jgi:hypothetical protein
MSNFWNSWKKVIFSLFCNDQWTEKIAGKVLSCLLAHRSHVMWLQSASNSRKFHLWAPPPQNCSTTCVRKVVRQLSGFCYQLSVFEVLVTYTKSVFFRPPWAKSVEKSESTEVVQVFLLPYSPPFAFSFLSCYLHSVSWQLSTRAEAQRRVI